MSADGTLAGGGTTLDTSSRIVGFDARSGMVLEKGGSPDSASGNDAFAYDAAGRQTQVTDTRVYCSGCQPQTTNYTRTYDAENHLVAGSSINADCSAVMCGTNYGYGPDGHVRSVKTINGTTYTVHWDGDNVLFTDFGKGPVFYIGKLGVIANGVLTVMDRDESGTVQSVHTAQGYAAWSAAPVAQVNIHGKYGGTSQISFGPSSCPDDNACASTAGLLLGMSRSDGYSIGDFSFQGVRVHDDTSSQWLTPDAYAGDVSDPMTQNPFMWNNNNPVQYGDPSGYESCGEPGLCGQPYNWKAPKLKLSHKDIYVKGDASAGAFGVQANGSLTINLSHPALFVSGGAGAGTPGASAALTIGLATASAGNTTSQVFTGKSKGGTFTAPGFAADHHTNGSGSQTGFGWGLGLGLSGGYSYGIQLLGGPGAAGAAPSKPRTKLRQKDR